MHQHRQHLRTDLVVAAVLTGAHGTFDHRVDDFQVRRVERQRQVHRATRGGDVGAEALVILHVTGGQIFRRGVVELGEQILGHLAQGIDQHVQAATVGHADDDLLHALLASALDHLVHRGDEALAAFEREALLADVLGVQETLETLGRGQALQDLLLLLDTEAGLGADGLQLLLPPALLRLVGDVHELGAEGAAVGLAQRLQDFPQGHVLGLREIGVGGREGDVHVGLGQVVERRLEFGDLGALGALERIEVGPACTDVAVGGDQRLDMNLLARHRQIGRAGLGGEGVGLGTLREGFDDGRMGDVARVAAVNGRHMLERVEIIAPVVGHGTRIVEVRLVHFFDIGGIAAEEIRVRPVLLHHISLTLRPGNQGSDGLDNLPRHG